MTESRYTLDVRELATDDALWEELDGSTLVVTGGTGLIGGFIAHAAAERFARVGGNVVLLVRDVKKAEYAFRGDRCVDIVLWDACEVLVPRVSDCDYIVHCASNTDSRLMVAKPVETILATVNGTRSMLELARKAGARMVFASSMEVYAAGDDIMLAEHRGGELDAMSVRSSYPQAKQLAETLCASYASEYGVSASVARLAQCFGPGVSSDDRRVFAEFARRCLDGRDIELMTDGSKANMYIYLADAARALLTLAACGQAGEAYNVANESTFCSVREMAEMVAAEFGVDTKVLLPGKDADASMFAVQGSIRMDTQKIRALGWSPKVGLNQMYARMIEDW